MLTNNAAYKYENPYNGQFLLTQCWTNGVVVLQFGHIKIRRNIRWIKPYISYTKVEYINPEKFLTMLIYNHKLYISLYYILNI